jgi:GAF domain-containing protein
MARRAKPLKGKADAKPPRARNKSPKDDAARVRDLEQRLAEALDRLQTSDRERAEALEQQTATSEILRVISSSPTDYQPVFDAIVRNAGSVCGALDAILWTADGDDLVIRAHHGPMPGDLGARQPVQGSVAGRVVSKARIVHVENLAEADDFPFGRDIARRLGWRTTLGVPLLRESVAVGAILIRRSEVRPFTPKEIALAQTFADQAVIAIENVRLFTELQEKNRALTDAHAQVTEALEQQTATSEVLKVISRSTFDLQPVLQTLIENATRLCNAQQGFIFLREEDLYHLTEDYNAPAAFREWARGRPVRPGDGTVVGRVALENQVVQILDAQADLGLAWQERWRPWSGTSRRSDTAQRYPHRRNSDVAH